MPHSISKYQTFNLCKVSFPLFPWGCTTAKYRSNAMTSSVNIDANPPIHAKLPPKPPPVITAHRNVPKIPFGWPTLWLKIIVGIMNVA